MNTRRTDQFVRDRMPSSLVERVAREVDANPTMGAMEIIRRLIRERPDRTMFFHTRKVGHTLTAPELREISNCRTIREQRAAHRRLLRDRTAEFDINPAVINRIKQRHNRSLATSGTEFGALYGAPELGYVTERHLTPRRAAIWLKPRTKKLQRECLAFNHCVELVSSGADSPERRRVARDLRNWTSRSMVYDEIKEISDGLIREFIENRSS